MVFTELKYSYSYFYSHALHIFSRNVFAPYLAFEMARNEIQKHFSRDVNPVYVGRERLPIDVSEDYHVIVEFKGEDSAGNFYCNVPDSLAEQILKYRMSFLTLDFDGDDNYNRAKVIDVVDDFPDAQIFKTHRGYHVRVKFDVEKKFEELIELRKNYGEDYSRIRIDMAYHKSGLTFLTNFLFNEKYWYEDGKIMQSIEQPVSITSISTVRTSFLSFKLPKTSFTLPRGTVEIDGDKAVFNGFFSKRDVERISRSIEDNLWEYSLTYDKALDLKERIFQAYRKINPLLAFIVQMSEVRFEGGKVILKVPKQHFRDIGRLIGKNGSVIKAVEQEVGVKISIEHEGMQTPEEVILKKKLQTLLEKLI